MWRALTEEIVPRAEEMACEKEMTCCVRGYQYTGIYGQQQLRKCLCVAGSQSTRESFHCKIIFAKNIFVHFLCTKIFLQQNKSELK